MITATLAQPKNRQYIINDFSSNFKKYQTIARNIAGPDDSDDLIQTCSLMILEMSEERLQKAWNEKEGLKPFFIRVLLNQYNSKTSKYFTQYRKQNKFISDKGTDIVYNDQRTEIEDFTIDPKELQAARDMVHILQGQMFPHPVHNLIFDLYVQVGSLRKALQAVPDHLLEHIDLKLVHTVVRSYRGTIKKHLNKTM